MFRTCSKQFENVHVFETLNIFSNFRANKKKKLWLCACWAPGTCAGVGEAVRALPGDDPRRDDQNPKHAAERKKHKHKLFEKSRFFENVQKL